MSWSWTARSRPWRLGAARQSLRPGTHLTEIVGFAAVTVAAIIGEVGNVSRFATSNHFATYTGTAPIEASSGEIVRHRLSRAGNRRLNSALHIAAMANKRHDPRGEAYYERKLAAQKGHMGALRCLKRQLSDVVFRVLLEDQAKANPGGQMGATLTASAVDQIPEPTLRTSHNPGSQPRLRRPDATRRPLLDTEGNRSDSLLEERTGAVARPQPANAVCLTM